MATLDRSIAAVPIDRLADQVRHRYRAIFAESLAAGEIEQLVLPWSIMAAFIVPTLWLAVPHTRTTLMRRANWAVVAWVVVYNLRVAFTTSSSNFASGYATGLAAAWGIISTLNVLVWSSPQEDAVRIVRRVKKVGESTTDELSSQRGLEGEVQENGVRHRKVNGTVKTTPTGPTPGKGSREYDYVWQPFPETESFLSRLNWAFDMTTNFKFAGWNWSISALPRPETGMALPSGIVDISTMPIETKAGYRRSLTTTEFIHSRLKNIAITYIILDFLAVFMMKDPYFILGPDVPYPLPPYLARLPALLLRTYRQVFSLLGVLFAILGLFNLNDLAQYYVVSWVFPARGELWQHATTMGSFGRILDQGLGGWWGSWWHQTFRAQFLAPAAWMTRKGYIKRGTINGVLTTLLISFLGSGFLHMCGSISSIPQTKIWRAPAFFLLQVIGISLQHALSIGARRIAPTIPRTLAQASNLASTLAWMSWTAQFFTDDLASAGIWLLEPVPFSFFRMVGVGHAGDDWWRWDHYHRPTWHSAVHWWQVGVAL